MKKKRILSRLLSLIFSLLIVMTPLFSAHGTESAVSDFTVEWKGEPPVMNAVATWTYEGEPYEMVLTGLKERLPDETLLGLAERFHLKENAQLTDDSLTDAEKFSHMIPHRVGASDTWIVTDGIREGGMWGDSLQCWAASAANMLASTGWSLKATDPTTGEAFTGEDAVFSFFTKVYNNDGNYQDEAIRRFFAGNELPELVAQGKEKSTALLPGEDPEGYLSYVMLADTECDNPKSLSAMVGEIKKGAALGICVDIFFPQYKLKENPDVALTKENGLYTECACLMLGEEEYLALPEFYWTPGEQGGIVLLTKEGEVYKDGDGHTVPAMSVKKDRFYYDARTKALCLPESENNGETYTVTVRIVHPEEEVDTEHPDIHEGMGNGSHAITVGGYIKSLAQGGPEGGDIRALFIADSDNDANIWRIDENTPKKEDRPNTYTLCYTEEEDVWDTATLKLTNYAEDGMTYVVYACLLYPKDATPSPVG